MKVNKKEESTKAVTDALNTLLGKKPIHSSNLALRFYLHDGWTKEELDSFCIRGEVNCFHPGDHEPYFVLDHTKRSAFDIPKLYEKCSKLYRAFDDYPNESDVQFMKRFNW
jgi:hypothetical protein